MSSEGTSHRFVLASGSPRRKELLQQLDLDFTIDPADLDETERPDEPPALYVERLAREKAAAVALRHPGVLVLAADTTVSIDGAILGKPRDDADARAMLKRLSTRTHEVFTGIAVGERSRVVRTSVRFRALSTPEIAWYVATGEPRDKAGAYAIQGRAGAFIEALEGSPTNVIGLPLAETLALLVEAGLVLPLVIDTAQLEKNLEAVEARIAKACARAQRIEGSVQLIAVTKLHPPEVIRQAYALGLRHFGENYAQELRDKQAALSDLKGLRWHAIGPVQTKNAKYIAKAAHVFHALESLEIARELSKRRTGDPLDCFVEVNVAHEASKAGLPHADVAAFVHEVRALANLRVVGLMAMPPLTDDVESARLPFRALHALAQRLELAQLSMGSTHDFEVAVEEGATQIRVGTALFGDRPT